MLDITMLGTGGTMPMVNRFLASMIINYKGRKILVDAGEGTQVAMRNVNAGFKTIDIICITHYHGDHIIGLTGLLSTIANSGREEKLTIIGPEGIKKVVECLNVINPYIPYPIEIIENPTNDISINNNYIANDIVISTIHLEHSLPCLGYSFYLQRSPKFLIDKAIQNQVPKVLWSKLQKLPKDQKEIQYDGKIYTKDMVLGDARKGIKLTYIVDTSPINEIVGFAKDSDLFVCEGTYGNELDKEKAVQNKHMTFKDAATLAKKSHAKELILTHFSVAMDKPQDYIQNAIDVFPNSKVATDGMKVTLKY